MIHSKCTQNLLDASTFIHRIGPFDQQLSETLAKMLSHSVAVLSPADAQALRDHVARTFEAFVAQFRQAVETQLATEADEGHEVEHMLRGREYGPQF